jgi:hypothetical protein
LTNQKDYEHFNQVRVEIGRIGVHDDGDNSKSRHGGYDYLRPRRQVFKHNALPRRLREMPAVVRRSLFCRFVLDKKLHYAIGYIQSFMLDENVINKKN